MFSTSCATCQTFRVIPKYTVVRSRELLRKNRGVGWTVAFHFLKADVIVRNRQLYRKSDYKKHFLITSQLICNERKKFIDLNILQD